jgi:hypothetical protein
LPTIVGLRGCCGGSGHLGAAAQAEAGALKAATARAESEVQKLRRSIFMRRYFLAAGRRRRSAADPVTSPS